MYVRCNLYLKLEEDARKGILFSFIFQIEGVYKWYV
jgi:hypothetical protein